MSRRQSAHVSRRVPADGGEPPNQYRDLVTVDLRVFWPPYTLTRGEVLDHVAAAYAELVTEIMEAPAPLEKVWLSPPGREGPRDESAPGPGTTEA